MNESWNLEKFVDALVLELDKTRETLSVKAINKPLSYSVKDMALDLQIFPSFDGRNVHFVTAQPGETGSSKLSIQLASITDRQVRETSQRPPTREDISIDEMAIDDEVKQELRKIGVTSVRDIDRMVSKDVEIEKVVNNKVNYSDLANAIRGSRRKKSPPRVRGATLDAEQVDSFQMTIEGDELAVDPTFEPVVVLNGTLASLLSRTRDRVTVLFDKQLVTDGDNELIMVLDPYSIVRLNIVHP